MSVIKVEQADLMPGYAIIESMHAIMGTGTTRVVAIKGGTHPKMRLKVKDVDTLMDSGDGLTGDHSFVMSLVSTTGGGIYDVTHKDGVIAGRTVAETEVNTLLPFAPVATSDETIFEADEDVIISPSTANGNVADSVLVVLKFEVVN